MKIIDIRSALAVSAVALNTLNLHAQTFHLLHTFADAFPHQDAPEGGLVLLGDTFYGTTSLGLNPGDGSVFSLNTNGGFQNLRFFSRCGRRISARGVDAVWQHALWHERHMEAPMGLEPCSPLTPVEAVSRRCMPFQPSARVRL